jgi:hypothetical protein
MTPTLAWPGARAPGWSNFRQAVRCVPLAVLHGIMAAAVLCVLGQAAAMALLAPSPPDLAAVHVQADAPSATQHRRARCEGCGTVEAIRAVDGVEDQPATYELTVRLKDGSIRTSISATAAQWRVGDRIIVMGGAGNS